LIAQNGVRIDTVIKTIEVLAPPQISLGVDTEFCVLSDSIKLGLNGLPGVYSWSTGASDSTIWVSESGEYALTFTNACGSDQDTVAIIASTLLNVSLIEDTSLCGDSVWIIPSITGSNVATEYKWMDASAQSVLLLDRTTTLEHMINVQLNVSNSCGSDSDSVSITFLAQPDGLLPDDSIYCLDRPFYLLNPYSEGINYVWSDSTMGPDLRVDSSGTYWLLSYNECDTLFDEFTVTFNGEPKVELGNDTFLCPGAEVLLLNRDLTASKAQTIRWSTGSKDSVITVSDSGLYVAIVTLKECQTRDSILILPKQYCPERCKPGIANVITPNGDGLNDVLHIQMLCKTSDLLLQIYNRWGQLVHQGSNALLAWDGSINGELAAEGTYFFVVSFTDEDGIGREYRGSFSLLRD
jgi:gliding motility-associated-like protein